MGVYVMFLKTGFQNRHFILIVMGIVVCSLSACTLGPPREFSEETLRSRLVVGDLVKIRTKDGEEYEFIVDEFGEAGLIGSRTTVHYQEIEEIWVERDSVVADLVGTTISAIVLVYGFAFFFVVLPMAVAGAI